MLFARQTLALLVFAAVFGAVGVSAYARGETTPVAIDTIGPARLPGWIVSVSPVGATGGLAQVRVVFRTPLVVGLTSDAATIDRALGAFHIYPNAVGHFRFVTSRIVSFESERALPISDRLRVTVDAGLRDVAGDVLGAPISWSFDTTPLLLSAADVSAYFNAPSGQKPSVSFLVDCNASPRLGTLAAHLTLKGPGAPTAHAVPIGSSRGSSDCNQFLEFHDLSEDAHYALIAEPGLQTENGNLPSERQTLATFRTPGKLKFVRVGYIGLPANGEIKGRFIDGAPILVFNNALNDGTLHESVTITPPIPDLAHALSLSDASGIGSSAVAIDPEALSARTTYTVHISSALVDQYGQHAQSQDVVFTTGSLPASLDMPQGLTLISIGAPAPPAFANDVTDGIVSMATQRLSEDDLSDVGAPIDALPKPSAWLKVPALGGAPVPVPLQPQKDADSFGVTAYAAQVDSFNFLDRDGNRTVHTATESGFLNKTNLGAYVESAGHDVLVHVSRLDTGSPVADATVRLLPMRAKDGRSLTAMPCVVGKTNKDGIFEIADPTDRCASYRWWNGQIPAFTAVVNSGRDWTFTPIGTPYPFYETQVLHPAWFGAVYTDRGVYRPGDLVRVAGIVRTMETGHSEPISARVLLRLDYKDVGSAMPDAFGRFSTTFRAPAGTEAPAIYQLIATGKYLNAAVATSIIIAEPRVPAFTNVLSVERDAYRPGSIAVLRSTIAMTTGNRLAGRKIVFSYEPRPIAIASDSPLRAFSFDQQQAALPSSRHLEEHRFDKHTAVLFTDRAGTATLRVPIPIHFELPIRYDVTADAVDTSGVSLGAQTSFGVTPSRFYAGLATATSLLPSDALVCRVVAATADGQIVGGQRLEVVLSRLDYGPPNPNDTIHEQNRELIPIEMHQVVSGLEPATIRFESMGRGHYRIDVRLANDPDRLSVGEDIEMKQRVSTEPKLPPSTNTTSVLLDQVSYHVGDVARAYVTTPYTDADVLVEVLGNGILWHTVQHMSGSGSVRVPIDRRMQPNARIKVVAFELGSSLPIQNVDASVATAESPDFSVAYDDHALMLHVDSRYASLKSGGAAGRVRIDVRDASGRPVSAACIVAVVDDAILSLDDYRFGSVLDAVFAKRDINEIEADNRQHPPLDEFTTEHMFATFASDQGTIPSLRDAGLQKAFELRPIAPVAFFAADRVSNTRGHLEIAFPVPGNATRWRVMVAATTIDGAYGNGESAFVSPQAATSTERVRFLRAGDRIAPSDLPRPSVDERPSTALPSPPPIDSVLDAATIDGLGDIVVGPGKATIIARGAPWDAIRDGAKEISQAFVFADDLNPGSAFRYAATDRAFIEARVAAQLQVFNDDVESDKTAYTLVHVRDAANEPPLDSVTERLMAEAHDPVAAGLCESENSLCAQVAEVFALDALSASGAPSSEHLVELTKAASEFGVLERTILARLLLQTPELRAEGERLAEELDKTNYIGENAALSPLERPTAPRVLVQSNAILLAIARGKPEDEVDALVQALPFVPSSQAGPWFGIAMAEYVRAFPPTARTIVVSDGIRDLLNAKIDADRPTAVLGLTGSEGAVLHARTSGGPVAYTVTTILGKSNDSVDNGITLMRTIQATTPDESAAVKGPLASVGSLPVSTLELSSPALVEVSILLTTDHPLNDVDVVEPLPGGLEAVDRNVPSNRGITLSTSSDQPFGQEHIMADQIDVHVDRCEAGSYRFQYLARVVAPGEFTWPGTSAEAHDGSGDRGRTAEMSVHVRSD